MEFDLPDPFPTISNLKYAVICKTLFKWYKRISNDESEITTTDVFRNQEHVKLLLDYICTRKMEDSSRVTYTNALKQLCRKYYSENHPLISTFDEKIREFNLNYKLDQYKANMINNTSSGMTPTPMVANINGNIVAGYVVKPTDTGGLFQIAQQSGIDFESLKKAQEFCQKDYETQIKSCLEE
jgi:hypothetical protein